MLVQAGPAPPLAEPRREGSCPAMSLPALVCEGCHRRAERGSFEACTWWPKGCKTAWGDPRPRRCWDCCTEDQRTDLVDLGCHAAAARRRNAR